MSEATDRRWTPGAVPHPRTGDGDSPTLDAATHQGNRYLTFTLDHQLYALGIVQVTEILEWRQLTDVPLMARYLRGVLNLRGRPVPVMDLASRFGGEPTDHGRHTSIVITKPSDGGTGRDGRPMGIMVDMVNKVVRLEDHDIEPAPDLGADIDCSAVLGVARRDGQAIVILDPAIVLTTEDLVGAPDLATLSRAVSRDEPDVEPEPEAVEQPSLDPVSLDPVSLDPVSLGPVSLDPVSLDPVFVAGVSELVAGPGIEPVGESVPEFAVEPEPPITRRWTARRTSHDRRNADADADADADVVAATAEGPVAAPEPQLTGRALRRATTRRTGPDRRQAPAPTEPDPDPTTPNEEPGR